jgi:hypothetical protein
MDGLSVGRNTYSIIAIVVGFAVLLAGFAYAMMNDRNESVRASVEEDAQDYSRTIIEIYGKGEGSLYLPLLISDPFLSGIGNDVSGRPAKILVVMPDNSTYAFYYPSRQVFEGSGGIQETSSTFVLIDMGEGRMIPGSMEVTVIEG